MRKNPRRILSPQRLPFRHPGSIITNLTNTVTYCKAISCAADWSEAPVSVVASLEPTVGVSHRSTAACKIPPRPHSFYATHTLTKCDMGKPRRHHLLSMFAQSREL